MGKKWDDIRKHKRVFFPAGQGIDAEFSLPGIESRIHAKILDLSGGGMGFVIKRHPNLKFKQGDVLDLLALNAPAGPLIQTRLSVEIRWVAEVENFANTGLGCRFIDIPEETEKRIVSYVEEMLERLASGKQTQNLDSVHHVKDSMS